MLQTFFPVSSLVQSIQKILGDEWGYIYDPTTEILPALNGGMETIVGLDPQALVWNTPFRLEPFYIGVDAPGAGFAVGDSITLAGGTQTSPIVLLASGVSASGGLDQVQVESYGSYTTYPTNPISMSSTTGGGSGATFALTKRGPKQELPPEAASLIKVKYNLGDDGQTMGQIITKIAVDSMDASRPPWPSDICGVNGMPAFPVHYMTDADDPKRFYLWPMFNVMAAPWFINLIFRAVANNVGLTDNFPLPAMYQEIAKCYVISRVTAKRDNYIATPQVAAMIAKWDAWYEKQLGGVYETTSKTLPSDANNRQVVQPS